jgi:hypothetical protein
MQKALTKRGLRKDESSEALASGVAQYLAAMKLQRRDAKKSPKKGAGTATVE